ncbi:hypothetical protein [Oceaniglobus roseus]|uniref:hypothetical protein n=1 Tax=Oceaniglobus roseus TaxID=1737570 RepID=UPI000C7F409D|nr:hypothetical protein [Kandeliimicrobium roseum]
MWDWFSQHIPAVQAISGLAMLSVWIVYLQTFLFGHRRQQRSEVVVDTGPGIGLDRRCFVANLGLQPIYLQDVVVQLNHDDGSAPRHVVTDRTELRSDQLTRPGEATNRGPLESGGLIDIGSFSTLLARANRQPDDPDLERLTSVEVTVAAINAASSAVIGGRRCFAIRKDPEGWSVVPESVTTDQIRWPWRRRRLMRELERELDRKGRPKPSRQRRGH